MDEPSAALAHDEVGNLFRIIRELTAQGVAVVYISHRLEEIREIGDRVTVLKDGRTVAVGLPAKDHADLAGGGVDDRPQCGVCLSAAPGSGAAGAAEVLQVEELTLPGGFAGVSFEVRAGEIVGLAGLVGSGRSEIIEAIYGARRFSRPGGVGGAAGAAG